MKTTYNKLAAAVLGFGLIAGSSHAQYILPVPNEIPGTVTGGVGADLVTDVNNAIDNLIVTDINNTNTALDYTDAQIALAVDAAL
ncbi:MAG: hypothetical protein MK120_07965, partial [Puniceicoccaceae bacterium]|nr:hypothetical protein [Puniceicoccaceae bacterium]